jgi:methylenetetrahydrofolate reductase (NADPH)
VPHIIARKLESREQLDTALAQLKELGVHRALCVAGDITAAKPAFDSSLEVLQTGLFGKYGFRNVGIAGHPEGSKAIGDERVEKALRGKAEFAKTAGFNIYFATQFGFDPTAFTDWEAATTAKGITLPIHMGMPAGLAAPAREVRDALRRRRVDANAHDAAPRRWRTC